MTDFLVCAVSLTGLSLGLCILYLALRTELTDPDTSYRRAKYPRS